MPKRRPLLIGLLVALLLAGGLAAAWVWNERRPRDVRGSATVEFDPGLSPEAQRRRPARPQRPVRPAKPARPRRRKAPPPPPAWPTYGYDLARTHVAPDWDLRPPFRRAWTVRTGNVLEFPPVVARGRLFVAQAKGRFLAIDGRSGKVFWRKRFRRCSAASPTVEGDVVYAVFLHELPCAKDDRDAPGLVVAMRIRGGGILWRFRTGPVESSPLLVNGTLYFGSWNHRLAALDVRGRRPRLRWSFEADDELNSSPAYAGGTIYIGSDGGSLYAVDARTGRLRWRARSFSRFGRREYFYATPTVAYGRVYIGNTDGTVYAYGAASGRLLWARGAGSYVYTAAAVWRRTVYVGSYDGNVYALDAATGDVRWRYESPGSIHGAPTVLSGLVYFSTCGTCGSRGSRYAKRGPRTSFALDARTGKLVWSYPDGHYSPVVADRERVYLTGSTRIYGLVPRRMQ
ncbi:MAG: PQQ-like beta-propeller repeat protein [Actinobacteria bacterium]|nr:PQQ-like beta-propeller repeat protein [Actinomycetota bacterium]